MSDRPCKDEIEMHEMWVEAHTVSRQLPGEGTQQGPRMGGMGGQLSTNAVQERTISINVTTNKL